MDIGLLGALLGGLLTLLSPCSVMLLPAFFSYAFSNPRQLLFRTSMFYVGLISTLVPLGVLAGTVGGFVAEHRFTVMKVAATVVIVLGVVMLVNIPLPFFARSTTSAGTSTLSVYTLGTVYGLAGVCSGPLLGAVLTVAAASGNALYGGVVLLFFALGMVIPLFLLALLWGRLAFVRKLVRPREVHIGRWRNTWTGIIGGILTIALGTLLLITDGTTGLSGLLTASQQIELEGKAYRLSEGVPDLVVLLVVCIIAGAGLLIARRKRIRRTS